MVPTVKAERLRVSYWYSDDAPIYALLVYGKNEKTDLKPKEAKAVAAFARAIKATYRCKQRARRRNSERI